MKSTRLLSAGRAGDLALAAHLLAQGRLVAFPTETVYGLGANALDPAAVEQIYVAKGRPAWDPLIVHVGGDAMLAQVAVIDSEMRQRTERLMTALWPGPLTLLLPRRERVPGIVTAGRPLVGVRMPAHPAALALIAAAERPLAAPSANRFGHTSPTTAAHVLKDLEGRIDAVLDGGACRVGVESTVVEVRATETVVYRPGGVTIEQIEAVVGATRLLVARQEDADLQPESLPSPGFGLRHYAPRGRLLLVRGEQELLEVCEQQAQQARTGVLLPKGWQAGAAQEIYQWGAWADEEELARGLFAGLREMDARGVEVIVCPVPGGGGIGGAIRDRLEKAARPR